MSESTTEPFLSYAKTVAAEINAALDAYTAYDDDCPAILRSAIRHSLMAGGKRLRPLLVLMSAEACGSNRGVAMPAACAIEMVHTYSLIHDDLPAMDDDDWRRGQPSCHRVFGEALAILAGDALLTQAFELISSQIQPPRIAAACCRELARAAGPSAMVGGQVDDLQADRAGGDLAQLERIHRRKTGAMFRASLRIGAVIADADAAKLAAVDDFGQKLGLAFQIIDDLLDIKGNVQSLGKSAGKDARQSKLTFPAMLGVEPSRRRAEELIRQAEAALQPLDGGSRYLQSLACYVLERSR
jgi:geranylgeranyl diphosphate synthase type II